MFRSSCQPLDQDRVKEILMAHRTTVEEKYLGLPTPEGRMSKEKFKTMKEWLVKRFSNWAKKYVDGGEGSADKICCSSYSNVCHGHFQTA
jgi:hypothetical protein